MTIGSLPAAFDMVTCSTAWKLVFVVISFLHSEKKDKPWNSIMEVSCFLKLYILENIVSHHLCTQSNTGHLLLRSTENARKIREM